MDAVPYKFVDSVVELFHGEKTLDPLAREVVHPLWKAAVDVHHRNREYYYINVEVTEGGAYLVAQEKWSDTYSNLESIRRNRRFARIMRMDDALYDEWPSFANVKPLEEAEVMKQLKAVVPQFEQGFCLFSPSDPADVQKIIVPSLFNRVSLGTIYLAYHGQITLDFLEDQINNSPYLETVELYGNKWSKSVLPLVESFCLKGRPGKRVDLWITGVTEQLLDINFTQKLFDHWKANGNLRFCIIFSEGTFDSNERQILWDRGQVVETKPGEFQSIFKHETEKSIAAFGKRSFLDFISCECGLSEYCLLKDEYPDFHNF
uniref:FBA_2 domain-containing protein n=1 Tax=Steinernema glaseri TaxID=37863 RepID=A0A1I7YZK8_9BILA